MCETGFIIAHTIELSNTYWLIEYGSRLVDMKYIAVDTGRQMSEGEKKLIIIRNGHALIHGSTPAMPEVDRKEMSPLSPAGVRQAIAAATWLRDYIPKNEVRKLEVSDGPRAHAMARQIAGVTNWGMQVDNQPALNHRGMPRVAVVEATQGWLIQDRLPGVYVAVMSGRAIRAMIQRELGLSDKWVDHEPDGLLAPGSIVSLHLDGGKPKVDLIMEGSMYMTREEKMTLAA